MKLIPLKFGVIIFLTLSLTNRSVKRMNSTEDLSKTHLNLNELEHLHVEESNDGYTAILIDKSGFEIVRGFGSSAIEAINDLHHSLI